MRPNGKRLINGCRTRSETNESEMSLRKELESFNRRRTKTLEPILASHPKTRLIGELVVLASDDDSTIQTRATWLLKRLAEEQGSFTRRHLTALFGTLPELSCWISK